MFLSFVSSVIISCSAVVLYNYIVNKKKKVERQTQTIFFTRNLETCRLVCFPNKIPCGPECSIIKMQILANVIESAEYTMDVCFFLITNFALALGVVRAHKRGVRVRIIYDENMAFATESKIPLFVNQGIPVKSNCKDLNRNMHHKYCVIDSGTRNGKLLTGSLNWTMQGLAGNYEYCAYTKQPLIVEEYQKMFNILWDIFETKTQQS